MFNLALFLNGIGTWEIVVILVIALLLFGRRLPDVGRSLGRGIVEFKKGVKGIQDEVEAVDRQVDEEMKSNKSEGKALDNDPPRPVTETTKVEEKVEA